MTEIAIVCHIFCIFAPAKRFVSYCRNLKRAICGCKDNDFLNQCAIFDIVFRKKAYNSTIFNNYYK